MTRLKYGRRCDGCEELYFPAKKVPEGSYGYCSLACRTEGQRSRRRAAEREAAAKGADLFGPITPEEVESWKEHDEDEEDEL